MVEVTPEGSKWDHPTAVTISEPVRSLVASTSKVQLKSTVLWMGKEVHVNDSKKLEKIAGQQEIQHRLAHRNR